MSIALHRDCTSRSSTFVFTLTNSAYQMWFFANDKLKLYLYIIFNIYKIYLMYIYYIFKIYLMWYICLIYIIYIVLCNYILYHPPSQWCSNLLMEYTDFSEVSPTHSTLQTTKCKTSDIDGKIGQIHVIFPFKSQH